MSGKKNRKIGKLFTKYKNRYRQKCNACLLTTLGHVRILSNFVRLENLMRWSAIVTDGYRCSVCYWGGKNEYGDSERRRDRERRRDSLKPFSTVASLRLQRYKRSKK